MNTIEHQLGSILFRYIDRLNDQTPEDNAQKIVKEMLAEVNPVLDKHFQLGPRQITAEQTLEMTAIIKEILGPRKASLWWRTRNPLLGNFIPQDMLAAGRARKLYDFVKEAQAANGPHKVETRRRRLGGR